MSNIKERLLGAITVMNEEEAQSLWEFIKQQHAFDAWKEVAVVEPDEFDLQMLHEAESDPDCHVFASQQEVDQLLNNP